MYVGTSRGCTSCSRGSTLALAALVVMLLVLPSRPATAGDEVEAFARLGDDLEPAGDTLFRFDGTFRTRGELLFNLDLDRGATPSGELFFPTPTSDPDDQLLTHADMRFRSNLALLAPGGGVAVKARIDIFDNLALGSAPDGPPQSATSQGAVDDPIRVRHLYGEALTPIGLITAGRMANSWGLGMLANDGSCDECDSGDAADRIAFVTPLFDHIWAIAYDFSAIGPWTRRRDEARAVDLDPSDDVRTITFAAMSWQTDLVRERRLRAERTTFEYGTYVSHRWQDDDVPAHYVPTALDAVPPGLFGPADVVRRDFRATAIDLWMRLTHPWVRAELEAAVIVGEVGESSLIPGVSVQGDVTTLSWGGALETEIGPWLGPLVGGVDLGVASGDSAPGFGAFATLDPTPTQPGDLNGPQASLPSDTTVDNFRFHPDYHVDRILFREIIGTVTDAVYVRPHLTWRIVETGPYALRARLAAVASWTLNPDSAPGGEQPLGFELDPTIEYGSADGFSVAIEHAVLFPLAGLDNPALGLDAKEAQLLRARMLFHF